MGNKFKERNLQGKRHDHEYEDEEEFKRKIGLIQRGGGGERKRGQISFPETSLSNLFFLPSFLLTKFLVLCNCLLILILFSPPFLEKRKKERGGWEWLSLNFPKISTLISLSLLFSHSGFPRSYTTFFPIYSFFYYI